MKRTLTVPPLPAPERLDKFLIRQFPESGRGYWRKYLEGTVRVDGKKAAKGRLLSGGETLELSETPPPADAEILTDPDLPLTLLYEDAHLLAVDKPAGLPCYPLRPGESGTLAQAVAARYPAQRALRPAREAGLVYRLDNDTSGVLLFARDPEALAAFRKLGRSGAMEKIYLALVEGSVAAGGAVRRPIAHHPKNRKKMQVVAPEGPARGLPAQPAETVFEPLAESRGQTLLRVAIRVGRRHQIRAHLAALGHPIVGDVLYGAAPRAGLGRHCLHAAEIRFAHPFTGTPTVIAAPTPEEWAYFATDPRVGTPS